MSRKVNRKSTRKSTRKSSRKSTRKSSRKSSRKSQCRKWLSDKIGINMAELKKGRWVSRSQAIAVSYSETNKKHPSCKKILSRRL